MHRDIESFYGTNDETYYRDVLGRDWLLQSPDISWTDTCALPVEGVPHEATRLDDDVRETWIDARDPSTWEELALLLDAWPAHEPVSWDEASDYARVHLSSPDESSDASPYEVKTVLRFELDDETEWMFMYATGRDMTLYGVHNSLVLTLVRNGTDSPWFLDDSSRKQLENFDEWYDQDSTTVGARLEQYVADNPPPVHLLASGKKS